MSWSLGSTTFSVNVPNLIPLILICRRCDNSIYIRSFDFFTVFVLTLTVYCRDESQNSILSRKKICLQFFPKFQKSLQYQYTWTLRELVFRRRLNNNCMCCCEDVVVVVVNARRNARINSTMFFCLFRNKLEWSFYTARKSRAKKKPFRNIGLIPGGKN